MRNVAFFLGLSALLTLISCANFDEELVGTWDMVSIEYTEIIPLNDTMSQRLEYVGNDIDVELHFAQPDYFESFGSYDVDLDLYVNDQFSGSQSDAFQLNDYFNEGNWSSENGIISTVSEDGLLSDARGYALSNANNTLTIDMTGTDTTTIGGVLLTKTRTGSMVYIRQQ